MAGVAAGVIIVIAKLDMQISLVLDNLGKNSKSFIITFLIEKHLTQDYKFIV